jgi:hypothetical protein
MSEHRPRIGNIRVDSLLNERPPSITGNTRTLRLDTNAK